VDAKEKTLALLAHETGIDLDAAAETAMFTVPDGKICLVHRIIIADVSANVAGTLSVCAGFGTADADDVVAITGGLTITQDNWITGTAKNNAFRGNAGEVFKFQVKVAEGAPVTGTISIWGHIHDA